jgi:hypothetical protein
VRDDDLRDALPRLERVDERVDVRGDVRPGIDDRDVAAPDDVGAGAEVGELARVLGDDAADQRRDLVDAPVPDVEVADERDRRGQGAPRSDVAAPECHELRLLVGAGGRLDLGAEELG